MPFVYGFLRTRAGGHPDHELPGHEGEVDPGFGIEAGGGHPGNALPPGMPAIPGNLPVSPPEIWPPMSPARPWAPIPPDAETKPPPGTIYPPVEGAPSQTYWVICGIPGVGWRYVAVDPSLEAGYPLPPAPAPKG